MTLSSLSSPVDADISAISCLNASALEVAKVGNWGVTADRSYRLVAILSPSVSRRLGGTSTSFTGLALVVSCSGIGGAGTD
jgi:hypothetical protein